MFTSTTELCVRQGDPEHPALLFGNKLKLIRI